jgi:hypothetical protein
VDPATGLQAFVTLKSLQQLEEIRLRMTTLAALFIAVWISSVSLVSAALLR